MALCTIHQLAVKEYSDRDIITLSLNSAEAVYTLLRCAVEEQNLGIAGEAKQATYQLKQLLQAYNEKLDGKKGPTVVQ